MGSRKGIIPEDILLITKSPAEEGCKFSIYKNKLKSRTAEILEVYCTAMSPYLSDAT